ncbi:argonaute-like protein [Roridomyces roridus]|uniref:Argonaute-like protein n=1 Tax=Roridomyces roridus TaxID=1738132 RepID=A0AAD7FQE5_9AGAR|nr:argonaute-like protein [Roridomyces roridus]
MASSPISVLTNSFVVSKLPTTTYHQYDSKFLFGDQPDKLPNPEKRQRLVQALQTVAYPNVFNPPAIYDGGRLLYMTQFVNDGTYRVHGSNQSAPPDARGWYSLRISRTAGKDIVPTDVIELMQGKVNDRTLTAANLLQLLICQAPNLRNPNNGRAYFSGEEKQSLRGIPIDLWRGFYQAVRPTVGRMLITVDVTVGAFYRPGPAFDVAMDVLNSRNVRSLYMRDAQHADFVKVARFLKNRKIQVKTDKNRIKIIRAIVPGPVGAIKFTLDNGETTAIQKHYLAAHNIRLQHPDSIGIVVTGKNAPRVDIRPLELCFILPGQRYKAKLPAEGTAAAVAYSAMKPAERLQLVQSGKNATVSPVQEYRNSEFLNVAGMVVDTHAISVQGKMLRVPSLLYGNKKVDPRDGAWNVVGSHLHNPKALTNWGVLNFDAGCIQQPRVQKIIQDLMQCCSQLGMGVDGPKVVSQANGHDVRGALKRICDQLGGSAAVQIIIVLLPANADPIRTAVKYYGDIEIGVRTQCLRETKLQRANNQYYNNVALKINARLGGVNVLVDSPVLTELGKRPFMIMGLDTSHPGPNVARPSVTSLVYSHDTKGAEYRALTCIQEPRAELVSDLARMVYFALMTFGDKHKTAPAILIFYRDGVSEGEFPQVRDVEIPQIMEGIDKVWAEKKLPHSKPKVTMIVVGKRHHVTFFPSIPNQGDRTGNCRAGLVVDDKGLTNPQFPKADFYLQSHSAIKGTSRSGHYTVLRDDNFNGNLEKLQQLSFALCHVYAKATRSVSIPAPVYYADLACARGKFHIDPQSQLDLDSSTVVSGEDGGFDLDVWNKAFGEMHPQTRASMYFL